jgi:hypothetical protein
MNKFRTYAYAAAATTTTSPRAASIAEKWMAWSENLRDGLIRANGDCKVLRVELAYQRYLDGYRDQGVLDHLEFFQSIK